MSPVSIRRFLCRSNSLRLEGTRKSYGLEVAFIGNRLLCLKVASYSCLPVRRVVTPYAFSVPEGALEMDRQNLKITI